MKIYKNCVVFTDREVEIVDKVAADNVPMRSEITVCSSDQNPDFSGYKCTHGVYIPATTLNQNMAPFCSLCYPYVVRRKQAHNGAATQS